MLASLLLAFTLIATPVGLDLRPTGVGHGCEIWAVPHYDVSDPGEPYWQSVVGVQIDLQWDQNVAGIGGIACDDWYYGGFHPNHARNYDLDDGNALWLGLSFDFPLPPGGVCLTTVSFPDAVSPFLLQITPGMHTPMWTYGTLVVDYDAVQLWDGVCDQAYLPEPSTLVLLLGAGGVMSRRKR